MLGASSAGDIWSTGAFSFESPLKDLLDSGNYEIEDLLAEDELLQELRGCHSELLSYFSTERAVTKLVQYVILPKGGTIRGGGNSSTTVKMNGDGPIEQHPPAEDSQSKQLQPGEWLQEHLEKIETPSSTKKKSHDPDYQYIRFPYMACEIICCEIPGIIDTMVSGQCNFDTQHAQQQQQQQTQPSSPDIRPSESHAENVELIHNSSSPDRPSSPTTTASKSPEPAFSILDLLFSLIHDTPQFELDDCRAGYLDKILTVLIRKRPEEMTQYLNSGGNIYGRENLMSNLLQHLYSHSIMQIAQRLLLPQRPVGNNQQQQQQQLLQSNGEDDGGDEIVAGENDYDSPDEGMLRCDWSNSYYAIEKLLEILIPATTTTTSELSPTTILSERILDLSLNASEVLITIIQNSMLSSNIMLSLTSSASMSRIVDAASHLSTDYFSPSESLLTSAMNVLESLILQLGGYGAIGTMTLLNEDEEAAVAAAAAEANRKLEELFEPSPKTNQQKQEGNEPSPEQTEDKEVKSPTDGESARGPLLIADLTGLLEHLPRLLQNFSHLLRHPSTATWTTPTQFSKEQPQPMLGNSRLRIVRVLESLVLLGDPDVDAKLVQFDCLEICLDLFWEFQWCSMLHQSVANLLVHVFEGQNTRYEMQQYFLVKCNLLGRLMNSFSEDEIARPDAGGIIGLSEKNSDVVENLQDMEVASAPVVTSSSGESEKDGNGSGTTPLPVSEDDVDVAAAMESQIDDELVLDPDADLTTETSAALNAKNVEMLSTEAVRFDSRASSSVGDLTGALAPPQVFRFGYMGHVIIICQALVHAYTNDHAEVAESDEATENPSSVVNSNVVAQMSQRGEVTEVVPVQEEEKEFIGPKDDFGEPLMLFEIVHTHPLAERWHNFVETVLATEIAIQSTALGGYNVQAPGMDPMQGHRPGLVDDGYMMGDDGERPPVPPRGMSGGGEMIDMDDNDLDVAASMMASLSLGVIKSGAPVVDDGEDEDDNSSGGNSGNSDRSYNSGETANDRTGYAFDDPLGKAGGLGIELEKLTKYRPADSRRTNSTKKYQQEDDNGSHSSSDEEPETQQDSDNDVPVMDLFAGNFNDNDHPTAPETPIVEEFANFAEFDKGEDVFGEFESATVPLADASPAPEHRNSQTDNKTTDLDDIFGSGDHANLLEEDDAPIVDSGCTAEEQENKILGNETVATAEAVPEIPQVSTPDVAVPQTEIDSVSGNDEVPSDDR